MFVCLYISMYWRIYNLFYCIPDEGWHVLFKYLSDFYAFLCLTESTALTSVHHLPTGISVQIFAHRAELLNFWSVLTLR